VHDDWTVRRRVRRRGVRPPAAIFGDTCGRCALLSVWAIGEGVGVAILGQVHGGVAAHGFPFFALDRAVHHSLSSIIIGGICAAAAAEARNAFRSRLATSMSGWWTRRVTVAVQCSAVQCLLYDVRPRLEGMVPAGAEPARHARLPASTFSLFRPSRRRARCSSYGGSRCCFFVREDIGWDGGQFFCFCACFGVRLALASAVWFAFRPALHESRETGRQLAGSAETAIADLAFLRCPVVCVPLFRCFPLAELCTC
jgi:hypothetical protein